MTLQELLGAGYGGYAGWDEASALADYRATGGQGKLTGGGGRQATMPGGGGGGGGDLWGQYSQRLGPATQQMTDLLKDYYALQAQAPTFKQKLLDEIKQSGQYPNQATMREEYAQNPNLTPMASEALVSRRGQSERGTIQDIINRAYGGFQSDIAQKQGAAQLAQQQRSGILEEYGMAQQAEQTSLDRIRQMEQDLMAKEQWEWQKAGRGSGGGGRIGTAGERQQATTTNAIIDDIENYMTAENLRAKYGGVLEDWELINLYNKHSPYGAMTEAPGTFSQFGEEQESVPTEESEGMWVDAEGNIHF